MSEADLIKGIEALEDDGIRRKVAAGDVSAAGDLDLDGEEQLLLVAAADDEAEVVGHAINLDLLRVRVQSKIAHKVDSGATVNRAKTADKAFQAMDAYIRS